MAYSLGIQHVGDAAQAAIFSLAVGPYEMRHMGLECPLHRASAWERVRRLRTLRQFVNEQAAVATRLGDALDMRYADTLAYIRSLDANAIVLVPRAWLESPEPSALPGLIWSLCTDPRPFARCTGIRLAREAAWLGCQNLFHAPQAFQS